MGAQVSKFMIWPILRKSRFEKVRDKVHGLLKSLRGGREVYLLPETLGHSKPNPYGGNQSNTPFSD